MTRPRLGIRPSVGVAGVVLVTTLALFAAQIALAGASARAIGEISMAGSAALNGQPAIAGTSVFSGDRVETPRHSTTALSLAGGREIIQEEPGLLVISEEDGRIEADIVAGTLEMFSLSDAPIEVSTRGVRIVPGREGGVYVVRVDGQKLVVTVRRGSAEIRAMNRTVKVGEGMECAAELGASQPVASQATTALRTPIAKFVLISAAMVSSATLSVILAESSTNCQVSPSTPGSCKVVP